MKICPADYLKAKKLGLQRQFPRSLQFCVFLPLSQIWSYDFFLSKGIRRAQICLTVQQILGNSTKRRDQSYSKDLYILCRKTVRSGIELRI